MNRFFSPLNPFDEAAEMAKEWISPGKNPCPTPEWMEALIGANYRRFLLSTVPLQTTIPEQAIYENALFNPESIRYQMSTIGRQVHPGAGESWRVELARFEVPWGCTGVVRSFEQYLAIEDIGGGWTVLSSIGNPFADTDAGIPGQWVFRLSPFEGPIAPWENTLNPVPELAGINYPDWTDQTGIWFPVGSDPSQNIRLTVPGGYTLRVFWQCGAHQTRPAVSAALKGSVQGAYSQRALNVSRGAWS